jgi:hypothetical protein
MAPTLDQTFGGKPVDPKLEVARPLWIAVPPHGRRGARVEITCLAKR